MITGALRFTRKEPRVYTKPFWALRAPRSSMSVVITGSMLFREISITGNSTPISR